MTVQLRNVSKTRVITLRYGNGLNKMIQLNPEEQKPYPVEMNKGLLQHYLSSFKGDLQVIDSHQPKVAEAEVDNDKETETPTTKIPEEKDQTKDGEVSSDNELPDGSDSETGEKDLIPAGDEQPKDPEEGSEEESNEVLTEKQLSKMNAEQVKELAKSLGIEITEETTKKSLIPVILEKQGK